jgi:HlyD family secretion protein
MRYLSLALLLGLAGCGHREDQAPKPVVAVRIARAEVSPLEISVRAPATVFPREQANVSARITAPIRELKVRKGDSVTAGQLLAVLENRDILAQQQEARAALVDAQATLQKVRAGTLPADIERARGQVQTSEAALNQAQKVYDRRSELFKQGAIPGRDLLTSQTELAQARVNYEVARKSLQLLQQQSGENDVRIAESRVEQAKARLAGAAAQMQFTELRSPFSGVITEQFAYPGDMAKPDAPVFTVMDLSVAVARAQVPETQAMSIRAGQACSFAASDAAIGESAGRVTVVNKAVDPARRTVEVWCEMPNPGFRLRAATFGAVRVVTGKVPDAVVVPVAAVQFEEGTQKGFVYVVDAKQAARRIGVETGVPDSGRVRVLTGIRAGDRVIVEGAYGLPDGAAVQIMEGGK